MPPSDPSPLVIWGASGHARVVADAVRQQGRYQLAGFLDDVAPDRWGSTFSGAPILGGGEQLPHLRTQGVEWLIVAIGDNGVRQRLAVRAEAAGFRLATVIHPRAIVAPDATIGAGTVLLAGSILNPGATLGQNNILNSAATVDHECLLGDGVHVGPGAHLGGGVRVGAGAWIAIGAIVRDHLTIGAGTLVGAGAVVVNDLPAHIVAFGVPATIQRKISHENPA